MKINTNDQLYVNDKWFFDVFDIKDSNIVVRIKYKENPKIETYLYKKIALPLELFKVTNKKGFVTYCKVDNMQLRNQIGGLIDRIAKEQDITALFEDSAGMGDVSMSGISSLPGVPGDSGSGDVGGLLPASSVGFQILSPYLKKSRKKIKTVAGKSIIKQPIINLKENNETEESDSDYKTKVFDFLDYPTDNEYDIKFIDVINKNRNAFLNVSADTVKAYFRNLHKMNKTLITSKTSEWFQNNIIILKDQDEEQL